MSRHVAWTALLVLALAGCDNATDPSGALTVLNVNPPLLAVDVPVTDAIAVQFSKALLPASVSDSTVRLLRSGLQVPGSLSLSSDQRTVSFGTLLGNNEFYVIEVNGVTAQGGGTLAAPFVAAFNTALASAAITDPRGDTYGTSASPPDIVALSATQSANAVTIQIAFAAPISPAWTGLPNAAGALIDIDVDQNPLTGLQALSEAFGPPGTVTGLGVEYYVSLFVDSLNNAAVVNIGTGEITGWVPVTFTPATATVTVPLALLGHDDGNINIAAIAGNLVEPTDVVPNAGHLAVGRDGTLPLVRAGLRARAATRATPAVPRRWDR